MSNRLLSLGRVAERRALLPEGERRWRLEDLRETPRTIARAALRAGRSHLLLQQNRSSGAMRRSAMLAVYYNAVAAILYAWPGSRTIAFALWIAAVGQFLVVGAWTLVTRAALKRRHEPISLIGLRALGGIEKLPASAIQQGLLMDQSASSQQGDSEETLAFGELLTAYEIWERALAVIPEVFEIYRALLPEFDGTVEDLVSASRELSRD